MESKSYTRQHAAAFVEFCKGGTLEEISFGLCVPLSVIQNWHRTEAWTHVSKSALIPVKQTGELAKRDLKAIEDNRSINLRIAQQLQEDLLEIIGKLRAGELRIQKTFANGTTAEVEPGLRERVDLAAYARTVTEMSYRALGDVAEVRHSGNELPDRGAGGQITIVLPAIVAAPRQNRGVVGQVVDVQTVDGAATALEDDTDSSATELPLVSGPAPSASEVDP